MSNYIRRNPKDPNNPYRVGQVIDGKVRCGGKTRNGELCMSATLIGKTGRCKHHGGKSVTGLAHPNTKDARYSKYLKGDLAASYEEILADSELVQLRDEIALITARIRQLTDRIETDDGDSFRAELNQIWAKFMHSVRTGDTNEQNRLLPLVNQHILGGFDETRTWNDISNLIDQRRKLVDTESRRMSQQGQYMTVEQGIMLATAIISAIKEASYRYADPTTARHILIDAQNAYNRAIGTDKKTVGIE